MKLLTTLYNEVHSRRAGELIACLERNAAHPSIDQIHVFYDSTSDREPCRVRDALRTVGATVREIRGRPTYGEFFRYANDHFPGQTVVLANADIYFNQTLALLEAYDWDDAFLAVTRDDFVGTTGEGSSDVWIFRSPIRQFGDNVTFGTIYCDQVISYLARRNGLRVDNPCLSLECKHLHQSGIRNRPGHREHNSEQSSTSDGLEGLGVRDFEARLVREHGIQLMTFAGKGGGMIWPSRLIVDTDHETRRATVSCRKILRWYPIRRSIRHLRRSTKQRIRQWGRSLIHLGRATAKAG